MYRIENFAAVVAEQRKKMKMTQEELANRLGITPQAVSKWENGIGYPDVTLFPLLSDILGIPIETLFGRTSRPQLLQSYDGLPLVAERRGMATYSNKTVDQICDAKILFTDGSVADLAEGIAYNRGKGEIRILSKADITYEDDRFYGSDTEFREEFCDYNSLEITISNNCSLTILPSTEKVPCVCAKGSARFISALDILSTGNTLHVKIKKEPHDTGENNSLYIHTPFTCGNDLKCRIDGNGTVETKIPFKKGELGVSGCGALNVGSFESLLVQIAGSGAVSASDVAENADLRVSGSGDIHVGDVGGSLVARIAGSGDIVAQNVGSAEATVSGSGDILMATLQSSLTARIAGSGDIVCKKECTIESLALTVSGACTLSANGLTVQNADIRADGNADITLARIAGTSVEKLSKGCRLTVKERG